MKALSKAEWKQQCKVMAKQPPLVPGRGQILVSREPSDNVLATIKRGGEEVQLIGVERYTEPAMRGIVVALGAPKLTVMGGQIPFWVHLGQTVTFAQYTGKQYLLGAHEFIAMPEDDVIAAVPSYAEKED